MSRPKGLEKTGGRQPGSKNKAGAEIKQWIESIIQANKTDFEQCLKMLEPKDRVSAIEKLMSYVVAKPQNLDISMEYRHLEALLERTPEQYIERITMKLVELNTLNKTDNENENE
jgi:hypothetical protein